MEFQDNRNIFMKAWDAWEGLVGFVLNGMINVFKRREIEKKERSRRLLILSTVFLGITIPIVYLSFFFQPQVEATWYDDSYLYRQKITFGNTGAADSNKKVKFDVDTAALITANTMQSDCDDIRFTDINGLILQFYADTAGGACNTSSSDYYALMPTINTGDTIVYMYYGNASATSTTVAAQFSQATFAPTSGPTFASEEVALAPVAYWKFNDGFGTTAQDSTVQDNDGTVTGAIWKSPGECLSSGCLQYDGSDDNITRADDPDFDFAAADDFTIQAWIRHGTQTSGQDVIIAKTSSSAGYKILMESDGDITFGIDDDATWSPDDTATSTAATYDDNQWHHISAVKDGTTSIKLYIDGHEVASDTSIAATGSLANSAALYIGIDGDGSSNAWKGQIDEMKIYPYARTAAQINLDFSARGGFKGSGTVLGASQDSRLSNGLVGYWKMNETSWNGTTDEVIDYSGNANHGTAANGPSTATGYFGNGGDFNSGDNNDYVNLGDDADFELQTFSVAAWVYREGTCGLYNYCYIFSKGMSGNTGYALRASNATSYKPEVSIRDGQQNVSADTVLSTNTWHHVAATVDGSRIKIYVNGVLEADEAQTVVPTFGGESAKIGNGNSNNDLPWTGNLDEVRYYSRVLKADEVKQMYQFAPGPVGYWPFNEGSGTATTDDRSSNDNQGQLGGSMTADDWVEGKFGHALDLDGTDDVVTVSNSTSGTITHEQTITATGTGTSVTTGTINGGTDQLYIMSASVRSNRDVSAVTGLGLTWTEKKDQCSGRGNQVVETWTAYGSPSSGTVKVDLGASSNAIVVAVSRYSGADATVVDATGENTIGENDTGCSAGSDDAAAQLTLSSTIDDSVHYVATNSRNKTITTPDADYAERGTANVGSGGDLTYIYVHDNTMETAGDDTANHTLSGSTDWATAGVVIEPAAGTSTNPDKIDFNDGLNSAFTMSAWVYADSDGEGNVGQIYQKGSNTYLRVDSEGGGNVDVEASLDLATADATLNVTDGITTGSWNHIAVTWQDDSDDELTMYINGVAVGTSTNGSGSLATDANDLLIGGTTTANFDGKIDEFRIYDYARTAGQIVQDLNNSHPIGGSPIASQVGYWNLDEQQGQTVNDKGFGDNDGTRGATSASSSDDPTWKLESDCKINGCASFDGGDYILVPDDDALDVTGGVTVSAWVNFGSSIVYNETVVGKRSSATVSTNYALRSAIVTDELDFYWSTGGAWQIYRTSNADLQTNTWYHLAVAYDETTVRVYKNGKLLTGSCTTGSCDTALETDTNNLGIGRAGDLAGGYLTGEIDEVKIYNTALTEDEILLDMNANAAVNVGTKYNEADDIADGAGNPPLWELKFDEGQNNQCAGGTNDLCDTSGNGYDGALTGGTWKNGCKNGSNCLEFNGTSDFADFNDNVEPTTGITIQAWIKGTFGASALHSIAAKYNEDNCQTDCPYYLAIYQQKIRGLISDGSSSKITNGTTTLSNDTWYHVAMTWGGGSTESTSVYLNAVEESSVVSNNTWSSIGNSSVDLLVGARRQTASQDDYFDGFIEDLKIYDYERTPAQIAYDMNRGAPHGHWKLDECSGDTAYDSGTGGNNGSINIGASGSNDEEGNCTSGDADHAWSDGATGKRNASLDFDGTDDYISVTTAAGDAIDNLEQITVAGWFNVAADDSMLVMRYDWENSGDGDFQMYVTTDATPQLRFSLGATGGNNVFGTVDLDTWVHYAATYDGTTQRIYKNGILEDSQVISVSAKSTTEPWMIGTDADASGGGSLGNYTDGQIDDVRIYPYALSANQIKKVMNEGAIRFGPDTGQP